MGEYRFDGRYHAGGERHCREYVGQSRGELQTVAAQGYDTVENVVEVVGDVGRHDDGAVVAGGLGEHPAECLFRSYVESVGRFVEQQHLCAECECDGDKGFASVAERQTVEAFAAGEAEACEVVGKESGVKSGVGFGSRVRECEGCSAGQCHVVAEKEYLFEQCGLPQARRHAVDFYASGRGV